MTKKVTVILIYHSFVPKMKSYGNIGLIPVGNKGNRLVDTHIRMISKKIKNFEIIISTGYESKKIQKYIYNKYKDIDIRCVENTAYNDSSICESLRIAMNNTNNDKILVVNGNFFFDVEDLDSMISNKHLTMVSTKKSDYTLDIKANINEENLEVEHISYGSLSNGWCEVLYCHKKKLSNEVRKLLNTGQYKNKILYELVNALIKKGEKSTCHKAETRIIKISNINKKEEKDEVHNF